MRAVNPLPPSEATSDKRPYEPSMEEILASIRRIIADDQSLPARGAPSSASIDEAAVEDQGQQGQSGQVQDARIQERSREHRTSASKSSASKSNERSFHAGPGERNAAGTVEPADHDVEEDDFYDTPIEPAATPEKRRVPHDTPSPRAAVPPLREDPREKAPLFSASTDTAVQSAFNMLAASRLANNSDEIMTLAREMIRPLLRTWIDDNLPGMVERMVRAEIERVARGR